MLEYIQEYGVISTLRISKSRFTECAIAAKKLHENDDRLKRDRKKKNDSSCFETFAIDGALNAACCLFSSLSD